jgi:hypothetical protein
MLKNRHKFKRPASGKVRPGAAMGVEEGSIVGPYQTRPSTVSGDPPAMEGRTSCNQSAFNKVTSPMPRNTFWELFEQKISFGSGLHLCLYRQGDLLESKN